MAQTPLITFVASASVTVSVPSYTAAGGNPTSFALPAVDPANTSLTITNNTAQEGRVYWSTTSAPVQAAIRVLPGQTILVSGDLQGVSGFVSVISMAGGTWTFTRGTATVQTAFTAAAA